MRIAVVCRSDLRGGAAVVSHRLTEALRREGADARMVVCEKLSADSFVIPAAGVYRMRLPFLTERLRIVASNGWSRKNLFAIDPATDGLPLHTHPWIRRADAVILNWVNQGMLSLKGLKQLLLSGKKVIWTMHDMWNMTGICHHAHGCTRFHEKCGDCGLLRNPAHSDISHTTWQRKQDVYRDSRLRFVAVSSWLARQAAQSSLLGDREIPVIHNAFPTDLWNPDRIRQGEDIIAFGAARLDDPVKGLPWLRAAMEAYAVRHPESASRSRLVTFGSLRDPHALDGLPVSHTHLGPVSVKEVKNLLEKSKAVLSTSLFETLPGTLIEGQAAGCLPIAFDRGGQSDIIDTPHNGRLVTFNDNPAICAPNVADAIADALHTWTPTLASLLHADVRNSFDAPVIARKYLTLLQTTNLEYS